jgi:hypothetical protein
MRLEVSFTGAESEKSSGKKRKVSSKMYSQEEQDLILKYDSYHRPPLSALLSTDSLMKIYPGKLAVNLPPCLILTSEVMRMNTILFTSSTTGYNDEIVSGLVHFTLSELLKGATPAYAAYHPDEQAIQLSFPDETEKVIDFRNQMHRKTTCSKRYDCVRRLMYELDPGNILLTHSLSDFGETASEAEKNYFAFLSRGITLCFFDMYFLNSDSLNLSTEPSPDQKRMIQNIIRSYYEQDCKSPTLSSKERNRMSEMPGAKKKSTH